MLTYVKFGRCRILAFTTGQAKYFKTDINDCSIAYRCSDLRKTECGSYYKRQVK